MKYETLVVNLFAGPGTGKSSTMAGVFSELKWRGVNCEMAPEFAKEKVWEESTKILGNQIYIFGKQLHTLHRVMGKVDVVITDSPLLLSIIYGPHEGPCFINLVHDVFQRFHNYNFFLRRHKAYNPSGRLQNEQEAIELDHKIAALFAHPHGYPHCVIDSGREAVQDICDRVIQQIGSEKQKFK